MAEPLFPDSGLADEALPARKAVAAALALNQGRTSPPHTSPVHLLLSGGGYRATLFHIGVLRYLYEHRWPGEHGSLLEHVNYVIGVSGGGITAAHFACHRGDYSKLFKTPSKELITFTSTVDLRRKCLKEGAAVADSIKALFPKALASIPIDLKFRLLGTDMTSGGGVAFGNDGIHYYSNHSGIALTLQDTIDGADLGLRYGVAASAAFPPFFTPLQFSQDIFPTGKKAHELKSLRDHSIGDGGIRDNLGIELYLVDSKECAPPKLLIVSDAGLEFDTEAHSDSQDKTVTGWGTRALRTINIQMKRLADLDLARLPSGACHIGLNQSASLPTVEESDKKPFSQPLIRNVAQKVAEAPTDLCCFSKADVYAIVRLGYDLAASKLADKGLESRNDISDKDFWEQLLPNGITSLEGEGQSLLNAVEGGSLRQLDDLEWADHLPFGRGQRWLVKFAANRYRHPYWTLHGLILFLLAIIAASGWCALWLWGKR